MNLNPNVFVHNNILSACPIDTEANWKTLDPIMNEGTIYISSDTVPINYKIGKLDQYGKLKRWSQIPYSLDTSIFKTKLKIKDLVSLANERSDIILANTDFTVPKYVVGENTLHVYLNGAHAIQGTNANRHTYQQIGNIGEESTVIRFHNDIPIDMDIYICVFLAIMSNDDIKESASLSGDRTNILLAHTEFTVPEYVVGGKGLFVYIDGAYCLSGNDPSKHTYYHVGEYGSISTKIKFYDDIEPTRDICAHSYGIEVVKEQRTFPGYDIVALDTGKKWIDDSAVYRKTIPIQTLPTDGSTINIPHNISNLSTVVSFNGSLRNDAGEVLFLPVVNNDLSYPYFSCDINNLYVSITNQNSNGKWSNYTGSVTIEYTVIDLYKFVGLK